MSIYDHTIDALDGSAGDLGRFAGQVTLIVNVASKCGLTPQYDALQNLQQRFADDGFSVLAFPCNQFAGQEPGSPEEIADFCTTNYGVTFPVFEKIDVNGDDRHPLYEELNHYPDETGYVGDIRWNFEKFLVDRDGSVLARFDPTTEPEDDSIIAHISEALAGS
ncbi:MAG: glutathione peroxidase [Actinobacteria bacterium]|nr:glutathione peroxidase [Actinomycetota bacterium]